MDDALDTVEHGRPAVAGLDSASASLDDVIAAIDKIVAGGASSFGKVTAVAFVPSGAQVGGVVGALLGAGTGELVAKALNALGGFWKRLARAATRLLAKALERIARFLGKDASDDAKEWLEQLTERGNVLGRFLRVDALKDRARAVVPTNPERGAAAVAVVARYERDQRWVDWGARVLGFASGTALAHAAPWGPVLSGQRR